MTQRPPGRRDPALVVSDLITTPTWFRDQEGSWGRMSPWGLLLPASWPWGDSGRGVYSLPQGRKQPSLGGPLVALGRAPQLVSEVWSWGMWRAWGK